MDTTVITVAMEPKTERLIIRCTRHTKRRFRRIAADFDNYEEALRALMDLWEENRGRTRIPGVVYQ